MPIYEYACKACDAKFEKLVKSMGGREKVQCPECGSTKTARTLSVFAVAKDSGKSTHATPGICGRCGGPGPCASDFD